MTARDTSCNAFEAVYPSLGRLERVVFEVIINEGPVHNLRILEALQQTEARKRRCDRYDYNRSNVWPRVTRLVQLGHVIDMGVCRGTWYDQKKTLHFWRLAGQSNAAPAGWTKVPTAPPDPLPPPVTDEGGSAVSRAAAILGKHAAEVKRQMSKPNQKGQSQFVF